MPCYKCDFEDATLCVFRFFLVHLVSLTKYSLDRFKKFARLELFNRRWKYLLWSQKKMSTAPVNSPIFLSIRKNVLYSNTISNVGMFQKTVCRGIGDKSSGCKQKVRKPEFLVSINAAQKLTLDSSCEYRCLTQFDFFSAQYVASGFL